jgi:drug/metabolite transporter (DMT)-like permease
MTSYKGSGCEMWSLIIIVVVIYGSALYANSIAVSLLGDAMPTSLSIFLNAVGRSIGASCICGVLWYKRHRAVTASGGQTTTATIALIPKHLIILVIPILSYLGYVFYIELSRDKGNVSVLSPIVGLYGIVPITVGLLFRGESKTMRKLAGIILSCVAIVVLGMSANPSAATAGSNEDANSAGAWMIRGLLFVGTFLSWGISDLLSASVKTDPLTSIFVNCVGQFLCATVSGFAVFANYTSQLNSLQTGVLQAWKAVDDGQTPTLPDKVSVASPVVLIGWPHVLLLGVNALSVVAWLAYTRLGKYPMSKFIPIVNSYACLPVLFAVIFMGESITLLKAVGIVLALAAVWLIGGGKEPEKASQAGQRQSEETKGLELKTTEGAAFAGSVKESNTFENDRQAMLVSDASSHTHISLTADNVSSSGWVVDAASKQYVFASPLPVHVRSSWEHNGASVAVVDGGTGGSAALNGSVAGNSLESRSPSPPLVPTVLYQQGDSGTGISQHPVLRQQFSHQQQPSFSAVAFPPASPNAISRNGGAPSPLQQQ